MRKAVVYIGTNSTRLFVAEVLDGRVGDVLERRTEITRLGAGVDADGRLSDEAMARVFAVLDEYAPLIERHRVSHAVAVAVLPSTVIGPHSMLTSLMPVTPSFCRF